MSGNGTRGRLLALIVAGLALSGCSGSFPTAVEADHSASAAKGWVFSDLDSPVDVDSANGSRLSHVLVNGNPAVAYRDFDSGDLRYVRATNANGTAWGAPVVVASSGGNGLYCAMAVVNGNPAVAFWDSAGGGLSYVRAADLNGTAWGAPQSLDGSGTGNMNSRSLVVVNGNPAISYGRTNAAVTSLCFIRAGDANGTAWGAPQSLVSLSGSPDPTPNGGCMAVVNGNPAISFRGWDDNNNLSYIRANDADGSSWGAPITLDSQNSTGHWSALAIVNGNPAISYSGTDGNFDLRYIRATNASGTAWGAPQIIDSSGRPGMTWLAVIGGNPAVSYYSFGFAHLRYIRATNADGSAWGRYTIVERGSTGRLPALLSVGGQPAIAYFDLGNARLRYARYQ